jgi:CHAT domain-containing protein
LAHAIAARKGNEKALANILSFASESQRMTYQGNQSPFDLLASLGSGSNLAESVLRNKGVVLDSMVEDKISTENSGDPAIHRVLEQFRSAGSRLLKLQLEAPKDSNPENLQRHQVQRDKLEVQVDELQKELARNVASMGRTRRALGVTVSEVQAVLDKDSVLVEFVSYQHYLGKGKFEPRYGIVLIGPSSGNLVGALPGEPAWVPLGSAEAMHTNLLAYIKLMRDGGPNGIELLNTLYAQLFEPIRKCLPAGTKTLIISPDGVLNFVSFATLLGPGTRFLSEDYTVEYVASGRDLVMDQTNRKKGDRMVAFANPDFGAKLGVTNSSPEMAFQPIMSSLDRRDYDGISLKALPGAVREADFLRNQSATWHLKPSVFLGPAATEAEVRAVKSPFILHLSTHGFLLPDVAQTNRPPQRTGGADAKPALVLKNPMHRSGLAFTGAQSTLDAWKRGGVPDPDNDGILMAQEVGVMDLKNTWLVVLSACDTGLGQIQAGEGVLGLRRGFAYAGAQNLLMTLWPVSDRWSAELMEKFYERAIREGNAPKALAEVQREYLVRLKKEKGPVIAARLAGPFVLTFQGKPTEAAK